MNAGSRSVQSAQALNLLEFPLRGSHLIEASAGTGKTFTIAMLYVRLVLGPPTNRNDAHDFSRALLPPDILVVTFTEAATQELRDRIRHRLAQAARVFRNDHTLLASSTASLRAQLQPLLNLRELRDPATWPALARRLELAAEWMDEAAVSTIHGWCNRMLREHAFDSNSLFAQSLETDQSELLAESVRDYWRCFMAPMSREDADAIQKWWTGPAGLQKSLKDLLPHIHTLPIPDQESPEALLKASKAQRHAQLAAIKSPLPALLSDFQTMMSDAAASKAFSAQKLKPATLRSWIAQLMEWAEGDSEQAPGLTKTAYDRLNQQGLAQVWNDPAQTPSHPLLDALAGLNSAIDNLPTARAGLLLHAAHWVWQRFEVEQSRRAQMGFNDLLTRLDKALDDPHDQRLAASIRRQFPVALIDEFQDTDPIQWRIFDRIYRVASNDPETALVLIGDPKQAIYAFRGADIYTYLQARLSCANRLHTLDTNRRSSHSMVRAVNHCFESAERQTRGSGAFLFRQVDGSNPVPFLPVASAGQSLSLRLDGQTLPALTAWCLAPRAGGQALNRRSYQQQMAEVCASEMVRLLHLGREGRCQFGSIEAGDTSKPAKAVLPGDMAVLVNNRNEADAVRKALSRRGVRSVYLSDRESVYQTTQAGELQLWLQACAEPRNPGRLRAALATATLGLDWPALDALRQDELAWETMEERFLGYQACWQRQGILPMVRHILNDFQVPARLLTGSNASNGERILTDVLHLAELLQQASFLIEGEHALVRHLAEQISQAGHGLAGDAPQLRLESDAGLVQVITVHKSKGLEYPLVFYPFACHFRAIKDSDSPLKWHDDNGDLQLSLDEKTRDRTLLERADKERLGEDLRKLYVALTRARHATWIGVAPIDNVHLSALGHLIGGGEPISCATLDLAVKNWAKPCADISVLAAPQPQFRPLNNKTAMPAPGGARTSRPVAPHRWWIASYSALQTQASSGSNSAISEHEPETPQKDQFQETPDQSRTEDFNLATPDLPVIRAPVHPLPASPHAFERGKEAGTFLHDLLEWSARRGFSQVLSDPSALRDQVARRCQTRQWTHWVEPLTEWLMQVIAKPLPLPDSNTGNNGGLMTSLSQSDEAVAEMEFWMAARHVETTEVDALVCRYTLDQAPRPALLPEQLNGMLKGFMDLVFEHQGRWYVADYKSNWLGPHDAAYDSKAMRKEVLHSRYDLQYALYLLALHRLLRSRLANYDYDRHIGGAVYIFLRGIHGPASGVHAERPDRALIEGLDALFSRQNAGISEGIPSC